MVIKEIVLSANHFKLPPMPQIIKLAPWLFLLTFIGATSGEVEETTIAPTKNRPRLHQPDRPIPVVTAQADTLPALMLLADGVFIVTRPITYSSSQGRTTPYRITVPRGFVTDLASIPWIAQVFVPKTESHSNPAILHDYLYWEQQCSRDEADALLLLEMEDAQVGPVRRWLIDAGLSLGGWTAWEENKGKRERGYIRVIPEHKFPCTRENPCNTNTRWEKLQQQLYNEGERRIPPRPRGSSHEFCLAGRAGEEPLK